MYLSTKLEDILTFEALVDTAADITVMSMALFTDLRHAASQSNQDLNIQQCDLKIKGFTQHKMYINMMVLLKITIGPMMVVHPVHVSNINTIPLLLREDLLCRFVPLMDYKHMKLWAQVRRPL